MQSSKVVCSQNKVDEFNEFLANIGKKLNAEFLTRSAVTIENQSQSMFLKWISAIDVIISSNRKKRGGGVAFFLKNNINCQIVKKLETNSVQLLTVAIKTIKEEICFSCIYMPPNCTNEANFVTVERYLDSLMVDPETKHVLCGDFNVNFLVNSKKAESLKSFLAGNGLSISSNNDPTRVSNG